MFALDLGVDCEDIEAIREKSQVVFDERWFLPLILPITSSSVGSVVGI